jgi:hypothetical protein
MSPATAVSEEKLKALYCDTKKGFLSLSKIWQRVKEENIPLSYNDVRIFLKQQKLHALTKQVNKPKNYQMSMPIIHFNVFKSISRSMTVSHITTIYMCLESLMFIHGMMFFVH